MTFDAPDHVIKLVQQHIGFEGINVQAIQGPGVWLVTDDEKARYITLDKLPQIMEGPVLADIAALMAECDFSSQGVVIFITNQGSAGDEQMIGVFDLK